jgi:hypothetical protein
MRDLLLCRELDRLLSSFMRLVESVRLNCAVKSCAHVSASGCCAWVGTGLRRGTPERSAMLGGLYAILWPAWHSSVYVYVYVYCAKVESSLVVQYSSVKTSSSLQSSTALLPQPPKPWIAPSFDSEDRQRQDRTTPAFQPSTRNSTSNTLAKRAAV